MVWLLDILRDRNNVLRVIPTWFKLHYWQGSSGAYCKARTCCIHCICSMGQFFVYSLWGQICSMATFLHLNIAGRLPSPLVLITKQCADGFFPIALNYIVDKEAVGLIPKVRLPEQNGTYRVVTAPLWLKDCSRAREPLITLNNIIIFTG